MAELRIPTWLAGPSPDIINVSPSLLADVLTCETKGWTRHGQGYTSKGDAMKALAGSALHGGVAEFLRPAELDHVERAVRTLHGIYDEKYPTFAAEELDLAYTPLNLERILRRWCEAHPESTRPWKRVVTTELAFCTREFKITHAGRTYTIRLIVRPDAIVEDFAGIYRFMDTKTTGWRIADSGWRAQLRLSLQFALYTDGVQQYGRTANVPTALGGWVNAIEINKVPDASNRKCTWPQHKGATYEVCGKEHVKMDMIEAMTTEERLAQAVRDAEWAARTLVTLLASETPDDLHMEGGANGVCRFCPASSFCEAGRHPESLPGFMLFEPWEITEGERA